MGFKRRTTNDDMSLWRSLTPQQNKTALLLMRGDKNRSEIAEVLDISTRTIDSHRRDLLRTLQVANNTQLLHFGLRNGLIEVL